MPVGNSDVRKVYIFDMLMLYIGSVSLTSIVLLALSSFTTFSALFGGFLISATIFFTFNPTVSLKDERFGFWMFPILIIAVILRMSPYLYVMGGQDQGTYINMSRQIQLQGSLKYHDYFRDTLNQKITKIYDKQTPYLLPGFQQWGPDRANYLMKFYPLHPTWMAIFGTILGRDLRVYSLTMFSLLSIAAFYLLACEISKKQLSGYLVAFLLAVNPAHVFFSKFPVTEIVTLAFTSTGFYYLVKYYEESKSKKTSSILLLLSALMFNSFFYTRMSGFLYMPFVGLLAIIVILFVENKYVKRSILIYLASVFALFSISFLYYKQYLPPLFYDVYYDYIGRYIKHHSDYKISLMVAFFVFMLGMIHQNKTKLKEFLKSAVFYKLLSFFIIFLIFLIFYKAGISFVLNSAFSETTATRWLLPNLGFQGIRHVTFYQMVNFISVPGFLFVLLLSILSAIRLYKNQIKINIYILFISLFATFFAFCYVSLGNSFFYNYYFSRYYTSEIVPYTLLLISIIISALIKSKESVKRISAYTLFAIAILYFIPFSIFQMQKSEMPVLDSYNFIDNMVNPDDILIVDKQYQSGSAMMSPIKYYYNKNVVTLSGVNNAKSEIDIIRQNILNLNSDIYFLTGSENLDYPFAKESWPINIKYSYFNNGVNCSPHAYSYLPIVETSSINIKGPITCLITPFVHTTVEKDLILYKL